METEDDRKAILEERFLTGNLSKSESAELDGLIQSDKEFAEELNFSLKLEAALQRKREEDSNRFSATTTRKNNDKKLALFSIVLFIITAVILLVT
ncbi:MAG: hypothetical protein AAF544_08945 [Bacteroidota bacterium]